MKKLIKIRREDGGVRVVEVVGDKEKQTWGKIEGNFIYDFMWMAVSVDMIRDGYKIKEG